MKPYWQSPDGDVTVYCARFEDVPHGGSGPDLPACRAAGLRLIWCDVEKWCADTAIARLGAVTPERASSSAGPLFDLGKRTPL